MARSSICDSFLFFSLLLRLPRPSQLKDDGILSSILLFFPSRLFVAVFFPSRFALPTRIIVRSRGYGKKRGSRERERVSHRRDGGLEIAEQKTTLIAHYCPAIQLNCRLVISIKLFSVPPRNFFSFSCGNQLISNGQKHCISTPPPLITAVGPIFLIRIF